MPKTLIVLVGPTAIGKTSTGINIARHFNSEIVSSDSRQIYKELCIGTAVPNKNELAAVPHHFIHTHSITENYNASKYETEAINLIERLFEKKDVLLLVGGSMLYIDAICKGIDSMPDVDPEIRKNLKNQLEVGGIGSLRQLLKKLDPEYYHTIDLKNPNRIIHALEIYLTTGKPFSSFHTNQQKKRPFSILKIGLNCERDELHRRINTRVDKIIENGLEDEARKVYPLKNLNALNTVGYREWFAHFDGEITSQKAIDLIKRNTRRYARKQLTWFRKDTDINWFEPDRTDQIISFIKNKIFEK